MPNYRLDLAYDGSSFHGYARQPNVRTVQGDLEEALLPYTGAIESFVAGRTDKGVHARGQVVSFIAAGPLDADRVMRSLNRRLAPAIAILSLVSVPDDFHARFSAKGRGYRYLVLARPAPDPFLAATSWHRPQQLDMDVMNEAARRFVGERDFASLCRKAEGRSTVRAVRASHWERSPADVLSYTVEASSFCHQMVRSMVAICVDAGRGKIEPAGVAGILDRADRSAGRGAAPPHGLTLMNVSY